MSNKIEKLSLTSTDVKEDRIEALRQIFPEAFKEGKIDWPALQRSLGEWVDPGKERFGLNWPGKADCMRTIQQPSVGTLLPMREESVNFDTTENLIIEGDNLEVLKLMQKSYYGKVKMIYIDPPYNTGNEFIYPDNFQEGLQDYLRYSGQVDAEGLKLSANTETDGRYHSKWLNMMYPRLYLARNLLREDGVIFISIDDHESHNLRLLMNEVFGEENFVADISVVTNLKGRNDMKHVATCHERLVVYSKPAYISYGLPLTDEQKAAFKFEDESGNKYALRDLRKRGGPDRKEDRPNMHFAIYWNKEAAVCSLERTNLDDVEILPKRGDGSDGRWRWGKEKARANLKFLHPKYSERSNRWDVEHRVYLNPSITMDSDGDDEPEDDGEVIERTSKPKSFWQGGELSTDSGKRAFKELLPEVNFDFPKSPELIKRCLRLGLGNDGIVLDFFSGSGTTAQAVIELNREDQGSRKFILVQLPEIIDDQIYRSIADIARERVKRVLAKIDLSEEGQLKLSEHKPQGFKSFKLGASNFKVWDTDANNIADLGKTLQLFAEHISEESKAEDILAELLLKAGFSLTSPVEKLLLADTDVFSVSEGALLICLDRELTLEVIEAMVEKSPQMILCLDEGFKGNDQLKVNAVQTVKSRNQNDETDIVFRVV